MTGPARSFFRPTALYFLVMVPIVWLLRDDPASFIANTAKTPLAYIFLLMSFLPWLVGFLLVLLIFARHRFTRSLGRASAFAFCGALLMAFTFAALKPTMPFRVPFYADPFFAELDRLFHFGHDPWELTHRFAHFIPPDLPQVFYFSAWLALAIIFPLFVVLVDNDPARVSRFLLLYAFAWVVLGNLFAVTGMSAGPVFFDRLLM